MATARRHHIINEVLDGLISSFALIDGDIETHTSSEAIHFTISEGSNINFTQTGNNIEISATGTGGTTDHSLLTNLEFTNSGHTGFASSAIVDTHISSNAIHFTESEISITESQISDLGTYATEASMAIIEEDLETHVSSSAIHFTETSISHTNINDIGTNTHPQIDTHIASSAIHFSDLSGFTTDNLSEGTTNKYDKTLILNEGSNITITGTYPEFTIAGSATSSVETPVGSIIAWLKSYTNTPSLPSGWVECNGQTLSDGASVYDGQVIPNLNANRFLRGSSTSGTTGGAETQTGTLATDETIADRGSSALKEVIISGGQLRRHETSSGSTTLNIPSPTTSAFSILPSYYEVVWIMRIK